SWLTPICRRCAPASVRPLRFVAARRPATRYRLSHRFVSTEASELSPYDIRHIRHRRRFCGAPSAARVATPGACFRRGGIYTASGTPTSDGRSGIVMAVSRKIAWGAMFRGSSIAALLALSCAPGAAAQPAPGGFDIDASVGYVYDDNV